MKQSPSIYVEKKKSNPLYKMLCKKNFCDIISDRADLNGGADFEKT